MDIKEKIKLMETLANVLQAECLEDAALALVPAVDRPGTLFFLDTTEEQQWVSLAGTLVHIQRKARQPKREEGEPVCRELAYLCGICQSEFMDRKTDGKESSIFDPPTGMRSTWDATSDRSSFRKALIKDADRILEEMASGFLPKDARWGKEAQQ